MLLAVVIGSSLQSAIFASTDEVPFGYIVPMSVLSLQEQLRAMHLINELMRLNFTVYEASTPFSAITDVNPEGFTYAIGDYIIPRQAFMLYYGGEYYGVVPHPFLLSYVKELAEELNVTLHRVLEPYTAEVYQIMLPRTAVYHGTGTFFCYLWHERCLKKMGFLPDFLNRYDLYAGALSNYDVFIMPGGNAYWERFSLNLTGLELIREFLQNGGEYVGTCAGAYVAYRDAVLPRGYPHPELQPGLNIVDMDFANVLPLTDPAVNQTIEWLEEHEIPLAGHVAYVETTSRTRAVIFPTSWFETWAVKIAAPEHPVMYGYTGYVDMLYAGGPIMRPLAGVTPLAVYGMFSVPPEKLTVPEDVAERILVESSAALTAPYELGKVVLFSTHPEMWEWEHTYRMIGNSVYYSLLIGPITINTAYPVWREITISTVPCVIPEEILKTLMEQVKAKVAQLKAKDEEINTLVTCLQEKGLDFGLWIEEFETLKETIIELNATVYKLQDNYAELVAEGKLPLYAQWLVNSSLVNIYNYFDNANVTLLALASQLADIAEELQDLQAKYPMLTASEVWLILETEIFLKLDGKPEWPLDWRPGDELIVTEEWKGTIPPLLTTDFTGIKLDELSEFATFIKNA